MEAYRKHSRHKKSQNLQYKWRKYRNGTPPRKRCHHHKCGCGIIGQKKHKVSLGLWIKWCVHPFGMFTGSLWTRNSEYVGGTIIKPHRIIKRFKKWQRKYARTVWIKKIKEKIGG